ncbi:MAG: HNH endonuclease [Planctomycetaceae bacterium]|nr:HNH endonuclease [Planctomycetaceae bacterium]
MLATGIAATPNLRDLKPLDLTQDEVHSLFELQDGKLFWRVKHKRVSPGDLAGAPQSNGYWRIGINGRSYKRSRLIWLYVHGVDSYPRFIDHINRDRSDDRIENLRLVTHGENQQNRSWGISRCRYVYREGNRWRARVSTDHGRRSLGRFNSEEEAIAAVQTWELAIG